MDLSKRDFLSECGKRGAKTRWDKFHKEIRDHLKEKCKPEDMVLKSRICGFLAADGGVSVRKENKRKDSIHYEVNFYPDHESLLKPYLYAFETLYKKMPNVKAEKNHYIIKTQCKVACLDLLEICQFDTYNWKVPFYFLKNKKMKSEWLRAFFDGDGYVGRRQIQVQSVNKEGIYQVKKLLEEFEIESKVYTYERKNKNWNTNYILSILKKEHRKRFLEKIGFNHEEKLLKLHKQTLLT